MDVASSELEQDGTWWQVGVDVLEAPFSHS